MDWNRVEGNWKQGKVKEQWGKLTDDDLDRIAGKPDQLEGKIQERYDIEKDRVRRDVDDWYSMQGWSIGISIQDRPVISKGAMGALSVNSFISPDHPPLPSNLNQAPVPDRHMLLPHRVEQLRAH